MTRTLWPPRLLLVIVLATMVAFAALPVAASPDRASSERPHYVPGELLIGWTPGVGPVEAARPPGRPLAPDNAQPDWQAATRQVEAETGLPVLEARPDAGTARLKVPEGLETAEIERLRAMPWVRYAEPNYIAYAANAAAVYPNDPDFPKQWHAHRVQAPEAWAATRGSVSFVVAVLDTGVARGHPEFGGKLLAGKNYINTQLPPEDDDPESHGTHVAGIIAAGFNNGMGIAGLVPDVKILPLKVLDSTRAGPYSAISQAIRDAANSQAQVINLSLVGLDYSQALMDAVNYAVSRGALVVAAGGNCAQGGVACRGIVNPTVYPAALPGALAVSASDRFDQPTPYSGYKPYIGIAAPGGTADRPIWSTTRWGYGLMYGTSMSTPMVSAAAALVWTFTPAASPQQVTEVLKNTADKVGAYPFSGEPLPYAGGRNDYFGAGRLNLARGVRQVYPPALSGPGWQTVFLGGTRRYHTRDIQLNNPSGQGVLWTAVTLEGVNWLSASPTNGTSVYSAPGALKLRIDASKLAPGSYFGRVQAQPTAPAGLAVVNIPVQLTVSPQEARIHLPLAGRDMAPTWYDPDAASVLSRLDLSLPNDSISQIPLPFLVNFYGAGYQALQVSDNGLVAFGPGNSPTKPPAFCPGNGAGPNNALYVFAADWDPTGSSITVHQPEASALVISWRNVRRVGSGARASFQLVLTASGEVRANYLRLDEPLAGIVGAENDDGTAAQTIQCAGSAPTGPLGPTVRFNPRAPWQ